MIVVPFLSCHVDGMSLQAGQQEMAEYLDCPGYAELIETVADSYSVFSDDGVFLACGGLAKQDEWKALAWSLIGSNMNGHADMLAVSRIVRKRIDDAPYRRIEAIVKDGFSPGHKWMRILGFRCETEHGMVNWFKDGTKAYLYSRGGKL